MIGMLVQKLSIMDYSKSVQTVTILPDTCVVGSPLLTVRYKSKINTLSPMTNFTWCVHMCMCVCMHASVRVTLYVYIIWMWLNSPILRWNKKLHWWVRYGITALATVSNDSNKLDVASLRLCVHIHVHAGEGGMGIVLHRYSVLVWS